MIEKMRELTNMRDTQANHVNRLSNVLDVRIKLNCNLIIDFEIGKSITAGYGVIIRIKKQLSFKKDVKSIKVSNIVQHGKQSMVTTGANLRT